MRSGYTPPIDGIVLAGLFLMALMFFNAIFGGSESPAAAAPVPAATMIKPDPSAFAAPYDRYVVTQGLHGYSYGHAAIDLSGGKGSVIRSPIHGAVLDLYVDWLGNTTLVLQNERYQVTLLHGLYTVAVGDWVAQGDPIGSESNQGYTVDFQGRSCAGRNCGYHTHLNVFDFARGENVNPLDLFSSQD
jgi:murein DD-endopeptidase MepM/ murein hydrolase activator NlpD